MSRLDQLLDMLKASPGDSFLRFGIAKEYEKEGQLDQAREYYERIMKEDPEYVGLYFHLGKLFEETDQPEKALTIYTKGIQEAENQGDLHAKSELLTAKTNLELELD